MAPRLEFDDVKSDYDEAAEQQKYRALREALETADAFRIRRTIFAGQTSSYVFQRNFHELMSFVDLHYKLQSEGKLGDALNREPLHEFFHELTRRLHNFVFAAACFVQHTDNFVREIHGDAAPIKAPYDVNSTGTLAAESTVLR